MRPYATIYISVFIKIGSGIEKVDGRGIYRPNSKVVSYPCFQNNGSTPKQEMHGPTYLLQRE
jgi:hypothetical protein